MLKSGTDYDTHYIILMKLTDHLNFSCTKYWLFSVCRLQEEYPQWFEKPVLEMVHHNTVSLDKLVEMAWVEILTKYAVGEECDFLVSFKSYFFLISAVMLAVM